MEGHTEELPEYSPNPGRPLTGAGGLSCEHRYALRDSGGRDWFSFNLKSRAADPKYIPLFLAGDTIKGEVQVDLGKAKTLKGLTVTVRGHGACHRGFPDTLDATRFAQGWRP
jgi:hypothetical protein